MAVTTVYHEFELEDPQGEVHQFIMCAVHDYDPGDRTTAPSSQEYIKWWNQKEYDERPSWVTEEMLQEELRNVNFDVE